MTGHLRVARQPSEVSRYIVARYNAEWLIEKNGHRSPDAVRAAWDEQTLRRAA